MTPFSASHRAGFLGVPAFCFRRPPREPSRARNPQIPPSSNPRRPRPGHAPRKCLCRLKSPRTLTNFRFLKMHSFDAAIQVFAKNREPSQPHVCRISKKNRQPILQIESKHESKHARAVCELCRHASACAPDCMRRSMRRSLRRLARNIGLMCCTSAQTGPQATRDLKQQGAV